MGTNTKTMDRRTFLKVSSTGAAATVLPTAFWGCEKATNVPSYLNGYEKLYADDPRKAAIEWFKDAKYGLFIHYGLCSLLGKNGWVMRNENIALPEYVKLMDRFTAEKFDADAINYSYWAFGILGSVNMFSISLGL